MNFQSFFFPMRRDTQEFKKKKQLSIGKISKIAENVFIQKLHFITIKSFQMNII